MQDVAVDNAYKGRCDRVVICIKVGEVWQSAEENKVRDSQVKYVNMTAVPLLKAKYVAKHNHKVARESNAELDAIGW